MFLIYEDGFPGLPPSSGHFLVLSIFSHSLKIEIVATESPILKAESGEDEQMEDDSIPLLPTSERPSVSPFILSILSPSTTEAMNRLLLVTTQPPKPVDVEKKGKGD